MTKEVVLTQENCLFLGTEDDAGYVQNLKGLFNGVTTFTICNDPFKYLVELEQYCVRKDRNIGYVATTSTTILSALLNKMGNPRNEPKLSEYAGSLFPYKNLEILILDPLKQLHTVSYGKFLTKRYLSKLVDKSKWLEPTEFKWQVIDKEKDFEEFYSYALIAEAISVDIETVKEPVLAIRCISFTLLLLDDVGCGSRNVSNSSNLNFNPSSKSIPRTITGVIACTSISSLNWIRKLCETKAQKIFQNGKYDNIYLLRHGIIINNWLHDTAHMMHSWYSELPKDLAFQNAFFLRSVIYWKDLANTSDLFEYYRYNAMDGWATMNVWIAQMLQAPDWAKRNYVQEFPLVFPCLLSELTGLKRDNERHVEERRKVLEKETRILQSLRNEIGCPSFNPGSHIQVKQLMQVLGIKEPKSSDEDALEAASYAHPLNARILGKVLEIRGLRKLRTTYLRTDDDITKTSARGNKEFNGYILYSINPHGTDTGRMASRESAFWCGLQIQNIPVGIEVKRTICAPEGFFIGECDLEQAESRDVAYLSGDRNLIAAVTGSRDFHSVNASAFFGIPYEELYDDAKRKTKNKQLRDISKRTNHGANYNMGELVLCQTMGLEAVWKAKILLKLPFYDPLDITEYLLIRFHQTYKGLKGSTVIKSREVREFLKLPQSDYKLYSPGTYYAHIATTIDINRMYVSRAYHHKPEDSSDSGFPTMVHLEKAKAHIKIGDWTRYCFGDPVRNKRDLNSYTAHPSQSLNAMTLNKAYMRVFYEIALPEAEDFRLNAQIHDSTLFCWREGRTDLPSRVKRIMEIPVTVQNIQGDYDTFTVPAALKLGRVIRNKSGNTVIDDFGNEVYAYARYWNETE